MTTRPTTEITRAKDGYWNSDPVSALNPGGMDESEDGTLAGHVENFPAAVQAVGKMTQWVGEQIDTLDAAVTTSTTKAGEAAASATAAAASATAAATFNPALYLPVSGGTMTGVWQSVAGTAASLAIRIGEATSGFYRVSAGVWAAVSNGVEAFRVLSSGVTAFRRAMRPAVVSVPWASTITLDIDAANIYHITLNGPTTFANPVISAEMVGQWITVVVKQDGTGARTGAFATSWKPKGGAHIILTTTAGKADHLYCYVYSLTEIHYSFSQGF